MSSETLQTQQSDFNLYCEIYGLYSGFRNSGEHGEISSHHYLNSNPVIRNAAIDGLLTSFDNITNNHQSLQAFMADQEDLIRARTVDIIRRQLLADPRSDLYINQLISDPSPLVRINIAQTIGNYFDRLINPTQKLDRLLNDQDPQVKATALKALALDHICRTDSETDYFDRHPNTFQIAIDSLQHPHPLIRQQAVEIIKGYPDKFEDRVSLLRPLESDPDQEVRNSVAGLAWHMLYFQQISPNQVMETFCDSPASEVHGMLMWLIADKAKEIDRPDKYIRIALEKGNFYTKHDAMFALAKRYYSIPNAHQLLHLALEDEDPRIRIDAMALRYNLILTYNKHSISPLVYHKPEQD